MLTKKDIDGGWAYVVLASGCMCLMICATVTMSVGMLQPKFLEHFEGNTSYVSFICAIMLAMQSLLGVVSSIINKMFSLRVATMLGSILLSIGFVASSLAENLLQLLFFFGILSGCGYGIVYTPCATVVNYYFEKNRPLANGIALSAVGVGLLSGPHLIGWLLENFGWRFSLIIFACITLQLCVLGSLFFPMEEPTGCVCFHSRHNAFVTSSEDNSTAVTSSESDSTPMQYSKEDSTMTSSDSDSYPNTFSKDDSNMTSPESSNTSFFVFLKKKCIWLFFISYFMLMLGYSTQIVHFPNYLKSLGFLPYHVPLLYTVYGATTTVSSLIGGMFFNSKDVNLLLVYMASQFIVGLMLTLMPVFAQYFWSLVVYMCIFSTYYGSFMTVIPPLLVEYLGLQHVSMSYGALMLCGGIAYLIGPPFAGWLFDEVESYALAFHIAGLVIMSGGLFSLLIPVVAGKPPQVERDSFDVYITEDPEEKEPFTYVK